MRESGVLRNKKPHVGLLLKAHLDSRALRNMEERGLEKFDERLVLDDQPHLHHGVVPAVATIGFSINWIQRKWGI